MIIIQAEDGAIITNPKEIYIDKDLDGHLHIYADLSDSDRVKPVKLTAAEHEYEEEKLGCILDALYDLLADPEELGRVTLRGWSAVCPYGGCCRVCMYESGIGGEENE